MEDYKIICNFPLFAFKKKKTLFYSGKKHPYQGLWDVPAFRSMMASYLVFIRHFGQDKFFIDLQITMQAVPCDC